VPEGTLQPYLEFEETNTTEFYEDPINHKEYSVSHDVALAWTSSNAGKAALQTEGYNCTLVNEPSDPHSWDDNFLCTSKDIGLMWSYARHIDNMACTHIHEGADPHTWNDNHLCYRLKGNATD
jgi:hypothetical protein